MMEVVTNGPKHDDIVPLEGDKPLMSHFPIQQRHNLLTTDRTAK
jgi:hypothetical protein